MAEKKKWPLENVAPIENVEKPLGNDEFQGVLYKEALAPLSGGGS